MPTENLRDVVLATRPGSDTDKEIRKILPSISEARIAPGFDDHTLMVGVEYLGIGSPTGVVGRHFQTRILLVPGDFDTAILNDAVAHGYDMVVEIPRGASWIKGIWNMWGTRKDGVCPGYCPECEKDTGHYYGCPERAMVTA